MAFIGTNRTRYSTEDLEIICDRFFREAKGLDPAQLNRRWEMWCFRFVADSLPVDMAYWSKVDSADVSGALRLRSGRLSSPHHRDVAGPWFFQGRKGRGWQRTRWLESEGTLKVLSPGKLTEHIGDLEALAMSGTDGTLPSEVTTQLMLVVMLRAGLGLSKVGEQGNFRVDMSHDQLYDIIREWVRKSDLSVRICKNVQDQQVKLTAAESIRRLLATYLSGGAANGMRWKRWTIRDKVSEYHAFWIRSQAQKKRLIDKGGVVPVEHKSPGDMLRDMAVEYDRLAAEWAKAQEDK